MTSIYNIGFKKIKLQIVGCAVCIRRTNSDSCVLSQYFTNVYLPRQEQ